MKQLVTVTAMAAALSAGRIGPGPVPADDGELSDFGNPSLAEAPDDSDPALDGGPSGPVYGQGAEGYPAGGGGNPGGSGGTDTATVSVTVNPVNDAPS